PSRSLAAPRSPTTPHPSPTRRSSDLLVTNEPSRDHTLDHRWGFIVLAPLAVAALLFLPGIGQRILYSGDEARYALLARNMVETRSEEHTSELQSRVDLVFRLLLEKKE